MSPTFHGPDAEWPSGDSTPNPYHELRELAERAGVSIEHLCSTVERAMGVAPHSKATPFHYDDFEEVVRHLADDDDYTDDFNFEIETKNDNILHNRDWHEWQHPRDDSGRFSSGGSSQRVPHYSLEREIKPYEREQASRETKDVHDRVAKLYPGLESRWSKTTELQHMTLLKAFGQKDWSCKITIGYELLDHPARRMSTMVHESLHAISPTTQGQYPKAIGWEEAVIDKVTRLHRASIAQQMGWKITKEQFEERDKGHAYSPIVKALEDMRKSLREHSNSSAFDEQPFYDKLMRLPATQMKAFIYEKGKQLSPEGLDEFRPIYKHAAPLLDRFQLPQADTKSTIKGHTQGMTRDELIAMILSTRTREEVISSRQALDDWAATHPDDIGIWEGGEMVEMLADAYGIPKPHTAEYQEYKRQHQELFPPADDTKVE